MGPFMTHSHFPVLPRVQSKSHWRNMGLALQVFFRKIKHVVWQNDVEHSDESSLAPVEVQLSAVIMS